MEIYTLHFDGSCGPTNPGGTAAYGYTLHKAGQEAPVDTGHGVIGSGPGMTNNLAEFYALAKGLHAFKDHVGPNLKGTVLNVYGDSQLVIKIMNRVWKAKPDKLYWLAYDSAALVLSIIRKSGAVVYFDWVPRAKNQMCDDLSKAHNLKDLPS